jgi:hypothetical protein
MGCGNPSVAPCLVYNPNLAAIPLPRENDHAYLWNNGNTHLPARRWLGRIGRRIAGLPLWYLREPLKPPSIGAILRRLVQPALVAGFLFGASAQAEEIPVQILRQPLSHVREMCAAETVPDWGCVTLLPAADNPNDVLCIIRIWIGAIPWETAADRLRPQCLEQP